MIPIAYAQAASETPQQNVSEFLSLLAAKIPFVLIALVIMLLSFVIGKIAKRAAQRAIVRSGRHEGALSIVGKTAYVGCVVLGLTVALKITGVDISFIVGASGFGLGFAMKAVLENYIAGVVILVQEPFRIGDMIQIKENFGRVEQIEARTTFIRLFDGQRIIIPNSDMISNPVINFSTYTERRITVDIGVSYDTDLNKALQVAKDALKKDDRILKEPLPIVTFNGYEDSNIAMTIRFWIDNTVSNWLEMKSAGTQLIWEAFREHDIGVSYPVMTLSMNKDDSDDMYDLLAAKAAKEKAGMSVEERKN